MRLKNYKKNRAAVVPVMAAPIIARHTVTNAGCYSYGSSKLQNDMVKKEPDVIKNYK